mmetsp:Transcript_19404/g.46274  ORF Transcript_19404/g.46274 Transcript_19404/m.46274 type:complete len:235 (-) Transcript_19404:436-1140(-)
MTAAVSQMTPSSSAVWQGGMRILSLVRLRPSPLPRSTAAACEARLRSIGLPASLPAPAEAPPRPPARSPEPWRPPGGWLLQAAPSGPAPPPRWGPAGLLTFHTGRIAGNLLLGTTSLAYRSTSASSLKASGGPGKLGTGSCSNSFSLTSVALFNCSWLFVPDLLPSAFSAAPHFPFSLSECRRVLCRSLPGKIRMSAFKRRFFRSSFQGRIVLENSQNDAIVRVVVCYVYSICR